LVKNKINAVSKTRNLSSLLFYFLFFSFYKE
jgi:hypothetical protein